MGFQGFFKDVTESFGLKIANTEPARAVHQL